MEINLTEEYQLSLSYSSKLKLKTQAHNVLTILQGFLYKYAVEITFKACNCREIQVCTHETQSNVSETHTFCIKKERR